MNNIKSFNEYTGIELEQVVYDQELNEGIMGKGLRGRLNKRAANKVRVELAEEIDMSKSIMDGIKQGLEELNKNFDTIRDNLEKSDDNGVKGEKQKTLDSIMKILENSRKNTWDLNQLIDEGEIDYTGFTANIGIASVAYFGILLTPFRAAVMIHKGYNYFFNIVKNTIRKSLIMLQLNFDQFENLIITQGFKSAGYIQADDSAQKVSEFYGNINAQLFGEKGSLKGKRGSKELEMKLKTAKQQFDQQMKADKQVQQADNAYNCLDMYNNTYTKSLEALRQYSGDDVQKHLDAIKASMSKLAGQEVDLQTYSELILAAAEEHAYKVSSSIYNKFAKMTEVFSLPNQQKLLDLILEANKEKETAAKKLRKEKREEKKLQEAIEEKSKLESEGIKVFKSLDGVDIGELDDESKKYDKSSIKKAEDWTYDKFNELSDDDKDSLYVWLQAHQEVLDECDETLQIAINSPTNEGYHIYIDTLIDYIGNCLSEKVKENLILNFDDYYLIKESEEEPKDSDLKKKIEEVEDEWKDDDGNWLKWSDDDIDKRCKDLLKTIFDDEDKTISSYSKDDISKLESLVKIIFDKEKEASKTEDESDDFYVKIYNNLKKQLSTVKDSKKTDKTYYIDFNRIDDNQISYLKDLYKDEDGQKLAKIALGIIGKDLLNDNTFVKNADNIISIINKCFDDVKVKISLTTYNILSDSIEKLKDLRNHDYNNVENTEKSEK